MIYRALVRPLLYALPAETAHHLAFFGLRALAFVPFGRALLAAVLAPRRVSLGIRALGLDFPTPVGLAAGFDKDATAYEALAALGFGFVEVGTLTGEAQPGNDKPRLFRLPRDRALVNRMGFNNRGAADAVPRLAHERRTIVGVNIGKTKRVAEENAADDYEKSARLLARHADYLVVNVSSPNTPGLRSLQATATLRPLLVRVRAASEDAAGKRVPLLVKIAPDLADADIDAIGELALELGLDGIIATNTTISRDGLTSDRAEIEACGAGGLSGAPLKKRARDVLVRLRRATRGEIVLIAAGGIETAEDAWARIRAGASLVQIYTGFVYEGPLLPRRMAVGLARLAARDGFQRVEDAIGCDAGSIDQGTAALV